MTILVEVEAVVNSCPLVYVDEDINSTVILTPSDFLSLHSQHVIPDITDDSDPDYDILLQHSIIGNLDTRSKMVLELVEE